MPPRTEADRQRAYEDLAVPNTSAPLEPHEIGYLELVASPDPHVAPTVFALEHVKVRLGRFTLTGTYATSPDIYVAVADTATAIAPMNTMFEFLDGRWHVFDTRSTNGTFVNGDQVRKRRPLAPGDVIDIGGPPADGGARAVYLGTTAPPGRAIRRSPALERHTYATPRRGIEVEVDSPSGAAIARLLMEAPDWRAAAITGATTAAELGMPTLPPCTVDGATVRYAAGEPLTPIPARRLVEDRMARSIVADLCEAAEACHRANSTVILGPFDRRLVFTRPNGRAVLFAAGLSRVAYEHDSLLRGATMLVLHFARSPEEAMGMPIGPTTDVWFAASFYASLTNGGFEPFPTDDEMAYFQATTTGQVPAELPPLIKRGLAPDPSARPTLAAFAASLRAGH